MSFEASYSTPAYRFIEQGFRRETKSFLNEMVAPWNLGAYLDLWGSALLDGNGPVEPADGVSLAAVDLRPEFVLGPDWKND